VIPIANKMAQEYIYIYIHCPFEHNNIRTLIHSFFVKQVTVVEEVEARTPVLVSADGKHIPEHHIFQLPACLLIWTKSLSHHRHSLAGKFENKKSCLLTRSVA
jgi:hypothetical protein